MVQKFTSRRKLLRMSGGLAVGTTALLPGSGISRANTDLVSGKKAQSVDTSPESAWKNTYSVHDIDNIKAITEANNGDYVIAGLTKLDDIYRSDALVIRLAPDGTRRWTRTYPGTEDQIVSDVSKAEDGFVLAGSRRIKETVWDAFIRKISPAGELVWSRGIDTSPITRLFSVVETTNSGFIAVGGRGDSNSGTDGLVVRTGSDGRIHWEKTFGGSYYDWANSVIETNDENILFSGNKGHTGEHHPGDAWVMNLGSDGSVRWGRTFGTDYDNTSRSVIQTSDGGFLVGAVAGTSDDSPLDDPANEAWLIKLDVKGDKEWSEKYGPSLNDWVHTVIETRDGDFAFAGRVSVSEGDGDSKMNFWVVKVSPTGKKRWSRMISNNHTDVAYDFMETSEGDLVMVGDTYIEGVGERVKIDGLVAKLDVNDPPTAEFTVSGEPMVGRPVEFSAAASSDPDGSIGAYQWDLTGDGSVDARGESVTYTFSDPGTREVSLTVVDTKGKRATVTRPVSVSATPTPSPSPTSKRSGSATASDSTNTQVDGPSFLGAGAGMTALAGALAWWRRRGED